MDARLMTLIDKAAAEYHVCRDAMIAILCTRALLRGEARDHADDLRALGGITGSQVLMGNGNHDNSNA